MKKLVIGTAMILCLVFAGYGHAEDKVTFVYSGEVIKINDNPKGHVLIGVDCWDGWGKRTDFDVKKWKEKARDFTVNFVSGKSVSTETDVETKDKFGRNFAYIWVDGKMLNEELILAGLGEMVHPKYLKPNMKYAQRLFKAQQAARQAKIGVWSEKPYANTDMELKGKP